MQLRLLGSIFVWLAVACIPAQAGSIVCTINYYSDGVPQGPNAQACNTALDTPTASLNWGNVLSDTSAADFTSAIDPLTAALTNGNPVTIGSPNSALVGVQNAGYVWNTNFNQWVPSSYGASGQNTFAGAFATNTTQGVTSPLGDNLLGIIPPVGASPAESELTLTFPNNPLQFIEFQVTSASNPDFVATLTAYDSLGNILGVYTATDNAGNGGNCASMEQAPPVECTLAPFVQFYDPEDRIASVELTVNDPAGGYIDTVFVTPAPEPSSFLASGIGIFALLLFALRRSQLRAAGAVTDVSDRTIKRGVRPSCSRSSTRP